MKFLLVLAFAVVACAAVSALPKRDLKNKDPLKCLMESEDDIELFSDADDDDIQISPHYKIRRWQLKRFLRKIQKKMPCGFPEYGVPPLAPLRLNEAHFELRGEGFETENDVVVLVISGFQNFQLRRFLATSISFRYTFALEFEEIEVSASEYTTRTRIDALETLGISVRIEATDKFRLSFKNVRIEGVADFEFPILKLKSLKTKTEIGKCKSQLGGILGNGTLNIAFNSFIETFIEDKVAEMTDEISDLIENAVKPWVNKRLNGTDFEDIVAFILNAVDGEKKGDPIVVNCVPPPDPRA